jgi:hypothetical protein
MTWPDSLPKAIRERPKTPLQGNILAGRILPGEDEIVDTALQFVSPYVDFASLNRTGRFLNVSDWRHHSILSLGLWMNQLSNDLKP